MDASLTVVSEGAGCVWCSGSKAMGQFEWEVDLQWECEERSQISSAHLRSYGSAWDSHRYEVCSVLLGVSRHVPLQACLELSESASHQAFWWPFGGAFSQS